MQPDIFVVQTPSGITMVLRGAGAGIKPKLLSPPNKVLADGVALDIAPSPFAAVALALIYSLHPRLSTLRGEVDAMAARLQTERAALQALRTRVEALEATG
jgi:hypothetical protein